MALDDFNHKSLGQILQEARLKNRYTAGFLATLTKLRPKIIEDLEAENFKKLGSPLYIRGYLKRVAQALNLESHQLLTLYQNSLFNHPEPVPVIKPQSPFKKIIFTPKILAINFLGLFFILVGTYLAYQFYQLQAPPNLVLDWPRHNLKTSENQLIFRGRGSRVANLTVASNNVYLNEKGGFETHIDLHDGLNIVVIEAKNILGKTKIIERKIIKE